MKKTTKITIIIIAIIAVIAVIAGVIAINSKPKTNLQTINSAEDLATLIEKIYEGQTIKMPMLMTQTIDASDNDAVKAATGLENANNLEYVVTSEPMMTSQAYSLVLVKVKNGVDANAVAKTMNENIDSRKWICVSAEKVYTTSSNNVVCLVMSSEEIAKPIYEKFKTLAGNIGEEYEKTEQEAELPPEMY